MSFLHGLNWILGLLRNCPRDLWLLVHVIVGFRVLKDEFCHGILQLGKRRISVGTGFFDLFDTKIHMVVYDFLPLVRGHRENLLFVDRWNLVAEFYDQRAVASFPVVGQHHRMRVTCL